MLRQKQCQIHHLELQAFENYVKACELEPEDREEVEEMLNHLWLNEEEVEFFLDLLEEEEE